MRSVCGVAFDVTSSYLFVIGMDDRHTASVLNLVDDPPTLVAEAPGQNGSPGTIINTQVCDVARSSPTSNFSLVA